MKTGEDLCFICRKEKIEPGQLSDSEESPSDSEEDGEEFEIPNANSNTLQKDAPIPKEVLDESGQEGKVSAKQAQQSVSQSNEKESKPKSTEEEGVTLRTRDQYRRSGRKLRLE